MSAAKRVTPVSREAVVVLWASLTDQDAEEAAEFLTHHQETLDLLCDHPLDELERAGSTARRGRRLPLTTWLEAAEQLRYLDRDATRRVEVVDALVARAWALRVLSPGRAAESAVDALKSRAHHLYIGGEVHKPRRWRKPVAKLDRISVPVISTSAMEVLVSRILSPDGRFSLDGVGEVFITQLKGYQRNKDERIYVDGLCALLSDVADLFFAGNPGGGRLAIDEDSVSAVDERKVIARLQIQR